MVSGKIATAVVALGAKTPVVTGVCWTAKLVDLLLAIIWSYTEILVMGVKSHLRGIIVDCHGSNWKTSHN